MKLHDLSPAAGSSKERKRIGRGPASGQGKTAGKGHKGHSSLLCALMCSTKNFFAHPMATARVIPCAPTRAGCF